jgi:XRE family transcriptional regulator, regulator of sulfur utilization
LPGYVLGAILELVEPEGVLMPTKTHAEVVARRKASLSDRGRVQLEVFTEAFSVGSQLAERRRELKLTQAQVADRSGVNQADVSRIERGVVVPSMGTVQRLAAALDARWVLVENSGSPSAPSDTKAA